MKDKKRVIRLQVKVGTTKISTTSLKLLLLVTNETEKILFV